MIFSGKYRPTTRDNVENKGNASISLGKSRPVRREHAENKGNALRFLWKI